MNLADRVERCVVVHARRRGIAALDEDDKGREHRGDRIAVPVQPTRRTRVDAVGQTLGYARAARTVLRESGRPGRCPHDATPGRTGHGRDGTRFAIERGHERRR